MAYQPPAIGPSGLTIPTFSDFLSFYLTSFQGIYGQNVYLKPDGADYQLLSIFAAKANDLAQAVQLAYNARCPLTAVGADLDSIVKLNGLARKGATPSVAQLIIGGTAGTVIANGTARDSNGYVWDLPTTVTIPGTGSIVVTATCETPGPIAAAAGAISVKNTPTAGWATVSNPTAAAIGTAQETDSALRARQALSVALPSLTTVAATQAAIAATPSVTRYLLLENPTGAADSYGNPAHSITAVVEGGTDLAVATSIYNKRGIGALTNGTTSVVVTDTFTGALFTVNFYRPTYVPIYVSLSIHGLNGYTSAVLGQVQVAVVAYLNSLQIGESITISALYGAALAVMPNLSLPTFSIRALTAGTSASPTGTTDIALSFNDVAQGLLDDVVVTAV